MNTFEAYTRTDGDNIVVEWNETCITNIAYVQIQVFRVGEYEPYFMARVPATDKKHILTSSDIGEDDPINPREKFIIRVNPIGAQATVKVRPWYGQWTNPISVNMNDVDAPLGKNSTLAVVDLSDNDYLVLWTGNGRIGVQSQKQRPVRCTSQAIALNGTTISAVRIRGLCSPFFWIETDGSVKGRVLHSNDGVGAFDDIDAFLGEDITLSGPGSASLQNGGTVFSASDTKIGAVSWVSADYSIMSAFCTWPNIGHLAPQKLSPVKVWRDKKHVSAITGTFIGENNNARNPNYVVWFVGGRGTLYQAMKSLGNTSTFEVTDDHGNNHSVAPGSNLACTQECIRDDFGYRLVWISADGAVKTLYFSSKDDHLVFGEVAPPGSAAVGLSSALEIKFHSFKTFVWWYGPRQELMGAVAASENRDTKWLIWEHLPPGTGRTNGRNSLFLQGDWQLWYTAAGDKIRYIKRVETLWSSLSEEEGESGEKEAE
ncbi:hypothetical protein TWF281_007914 [Arthrobotrys megalospora]